METATKPKAPHLVWDRGVPIWRATRAAIKAGFPTKRVNLTFFANDETALIARCQRLTAEMNDWLSGRRNIDPLFDGTIRAVINLWQADPSSPYHGLEASSRHPYDVYARMIVATVGQRRVDAVDSRDLRRWHAEWSAPIKPGGNPRIAAARMAMIVLKTALTFAAGCRKPACKELREISETLLSQHHGRARKRPPLPMSLRGKRHTNWATRRLRSRTLQFEGAMRQWDTIGKWVPLSDKRPSLIIDGGKKWLGPTWSQIDEHNILRYTPSKTLHTSGAEVVLDLNKLPMVLEELAKVPAEARRGPLIVNPRTGFPTGPSISVCCGTKCEASLASARKSGTATRAQRRSRRAGKQARPPTIWRRRRVMPISAQPPKSMTATE